jgi:hypothetical protein
MVITRILRETTIVQVQEEPITKEKKERQRKI